MSKPSTLLYPTEFITVTTRRLSRRLRGVQRLVKKGVVMAPNDAKLRGEEIIDEEFKSYIARVNGYLMRHSLDPITGEEPGIVDPLRQCKESWSGIVDDMFRA